MEQFEQLDQLDQFEQTPRLKSLHGWHAASKSAALTPTCAGPVPAFDRWLDRLLTWYAPDVYTLEQKAVHNPLLWWTTKISGRPYDRATLRRDAGRRLIMYLPAAPLICLLWPVWQASIPTHPNRLSMMLALMAMVLVAQGVVVDLGLLTQVVHLVRQRFDSGEWEMLRMTNVPAEDILNAEFTATQLRAWSVLFNQAGLRTALLLVAVGLYPGTAFTLLLTLPVSGYLLILLLALLSEPVWRMRAIAALGLAAAAFIQNTENIATALLAAFGVVALIHLALLAVCGALWYFSTVVMAESSSLFCMFPLAVGAAVYVIYTGYRTVQRQSLRLARHAGFDPR